ncbi:type I-B CRISPR-associated endonuclease Cas1b [Thermoactinomyces sp. FSL K6-2592]|uniref:type I-B CRISPR-associated endonuclease Cas1b n=1 Tax=Thermoactinomyces sp. FSL K6-2592 TaxID=2975347 RepID=UPI0030F86DC3
MKKPIYITSHGELKRKDNTLFFETEEGVRYIPVEDTKEIHVLGEVTITKKFLEFCAQKGILLHFYNFHEYYTGSFYPKEHLNSGYMIVKQTEYYLDGEKRLDLSKRFVSGSLLNLEQVLKYYVNRGKPVEPILERIGKERENVDGVGDIPALMGIEGRAREAYYSAFDLILENKDFVFEKRSRRPPLNRMNALISLGNQLLYNIVLSEIYKTHLDPRIGFLHSSNFRRFSLNLDVAEIFKPIIVDRVILSLIGKKELQAKDFSKEFQGVVLKDKAYSLFLRKFDERLQATIKHRKLRRNVSYRSLIRMELYKVQKHLIGEEEYEPYKSLW